MVRYYGLYANRNATLSDAASTEAAAGPASAGNQGKPSVDAVQSTDTAQPAEATAPDFSLFEQHFAHVYGRQALQCQTCAKPFLYSGQFFPAHKTNPLSTGPPGFQPAITRWDSS
jgi:hypothetical protein